MRKRLSLAILASPLAVCVLIAGLAATSAHAGPRAGQVRAT